VRRRRRGPTLGGLSPSWRWEIGAPLVLLGTSIAISALAIANAGVLFWVGVALIVLGLAAFRAG
jgi:hypothetical protein